MKPTPNDLSELPLPATVEACHTVIRESCGLLQEMRQRLLVLEELVKLNSRTSSKPPSSDGPAGRGSRAPKPKSARKVGAQPGHKGSFRAMLPSDQVDQQVVCQPEPQCARCHGDVMVDENKVIRHQVFELPPITPVVTEYLRLRGVCSGCGNKHHGPLPVGVPSGQLGPRALALVGTLSGQFHLTQGKIQRLLEQVMGLKFSIGTNSMAHGHVAQALSEPVQHLQGGAAQTACSRTANTCANLLKIEPALWHFLRNPAVPPTNNAAERALRGFVIKRKLSFFTRSGRGLRFLERIFSTVQTCSIQGKQTFGYLQEVMQAWVARQTAPSLVPEHVLARQAACA